MLGAAGAAARRGRIAVDVMHQHVGIYAALRRIA